MNLKARKDNFRLLLPKEFIPDEINEKYTKILQDMHSFTTTPIDFVNESIQKVEAFGVSNATVMQKQGGRGVPIINSERQEENNFLHTQTDYVYRSEVNPLELIDKTINIDFRHTLGYINYFIILESFYYQYSRDRKKSELPPNFFLDLTNEIGAIWARVELVCPVIDSMDMLDFDYSQPVAQSGTFRVIWKYSNLDYQFLDYDANTEKTIYR